MTAVRCVAVAKILSGVRWRDASIRFAGGVRTLQKVWCNALVEGGFVQVTKRRHVVSVKSKVSYMHVASATAVAARSIAMNAAWNLVGIYFVEIVSKREILYLHFHIHATDGAVQNISWKNFCLDVHLTLECL